MKLIILSVVVAVTLNHVAATPCLVGAPQCYAPPPQVCYAPSPVPASVTLYKQSCYNPKLALYEKFPLLYKMYAKGCKLFCDKVNGVNPCTTASKFVVGAPPAPLFGTPAPCKIPFYHVAARPEPVQPALSPEALNTLLAFSEASSGPAPALAPALGCACS